MAITIKFDNTHTPQAPTFLLANRSGHKLGYIPAVNVSFSDHLSSASDLQFVVNKADNGVEYELWDSIEDFKLVWCPEWDAWFEIYVEIKDGDSASKNVTGRSLGEAELSQINLYGIEINTETDISREDYAPTVLYNERNHAASLLHRIMEKAPHYSIGHVDSSIMNIQRTFTFDGTSILDALYQIGEEIDCLFIIHSDSDENGKPLRMVSAYDLENMCLACNYRGVITGTCPECGSVNIAYGYGQDTSIYVSSANLTDEITYTCETDSVKNCFRLEAGDDLMTATIANCNPNGSAYIWRIPESMRNDMSDELRTKLEQYDASYEYYMNTHDASVPIALRSQYNALVTKYRAYDTSLSVLPNTIKGHPALMKAYYNAVDFESYLRNELMPSPTLSTTTAQTEAAKLIAGNLSPTAVTSLSACSLATASSAVLAVAKTTVDKNYQVKVQSSSFSNNVWRGTFLVVNYSDDEDSATSNTVSVTITDDQATYLRQRIKKITSDSSGSATNISELFALNLTQFTNEIKKHCLENLNSFRDACQGCMDLLIENGVADRTEWSGSATDLYTQMYLPYYNKLNAINTEIKLRESELEIIAGKMDEKGGVVQDGVESYIQKQSDAIQKMLNMESYLGTQLSQELAAYRREDTYSNSNYISDGLSNDEIFSNALEFIDRAKTEIYKSSTLQHRITATLKNLLTIREFSPLVDSFCVGNWITVRVDNKCYRLRLISYEIDFSDLENLEVEFSDVVETVFGRNDIESILKNASSMSSSYSYVQHQASRGSKTQDQMAEVINNGLRLTTIKIINSAENQNVSFDQNGLLCRQMDPYDGGYNAYQLKIINRGMYITDDGWQTAKAGIGSFMYYDPDTGRETEKYGVIADTIIGNVILAGRVGVYNKSGTIKLDENGITLVSNKSGVKDVFKVQSKAANGTLTDIIYFDSDGNAHFNGALDAASGTFSGALSADCINGGTLTLGGNNNVNGQVRILNASGAEIGKWNKDGIMIDGGNIKITRSNGGYFQASSSALGFYNASGGALMTLSNGTLTASNIALTGGNIRIDKDNGGGYFKASASELGFYNTNGALMTVSDSGGLTASSLNITGGSIDLGDGEFVVNSSGTVTIRSGLINLGSGNFVVNSGGDVTIRSGSINIGGGNFVVDTSGSFTAKSASINGTVYSENFNGEYIKIGDGIISGGLSTNNTTYGSIDFRGVSGYSYGPYIESNSIFLYTNNILVKDGSYTLRPAYTGSITYISSITERNNTLYWTSKTMQFVNGLLISGG